MSKKKGITVLKKYRPLTDTELATELTPTLPKKVIPLNRNTNTNVEEIDHSGMDVVKETSGLSLTGLVLSVLSFFFLPYVLAPAGILFGYFGYRKDNHNLGMWAIGLGVAGLFGTMIVSAMVF